MSSHFSFIVPSISIDTAYNDNLTSALESKLIKSKVKFI